MGRRPSREGAFVAKLRERYPQFEIADSDPILDRMRIVKSEREIELIRRASRLAALGIMEAIRSTGPELVARGSGSISSMPRRATSISPAGRRGEAYRSITATGTNAFFGHYYRNASRLEPGELVLMDYAPDYRYYTSDVARMWPCRDFRPRPARALRLDPGLLPRAPEAHPPGVTADQVMDETAG